MTTHLNNSGSDLDAMRAEAARIRAAQASSTLPQTGQGSAQMPSQSTMRAPAGGAPPARSNVRPSIKRGRSMTHGGVKAVLVRLKRPFIILLAFAAFIAVVYFATPMVNAGFHAVWVAPYLKYAILAAFTLWLIIVLRPLEKGWAYGFARDLGADPWHVIDKYTFAPVRRFVGRLSRGLASWPMRIVYVLVLGAVAGGLIFGVPSFVSEQARRITDGSYNIPFLNVVSSDRTVEVQPSIGNFECGAGKTASLNGGGSFNGVTYKVDKTSDKLEITFSATPKNLSGFVTPGRVVTLGADEAKRRTFVFDKVAFGGKLPKSIAICSTQ